MINIKVKDHEAEIQTEGMLISIAVELATAIKLMYEDISSDNRAAGDAFKKVMKIMIASEDTPLWKNDKRDVAKFLFKDNDLWKVD